MKYILKFGNNKDNASTIFVGTDDECMDYLRKDVAHTLGQETPYYLRRWKRDNTDIIDYGSWSNFYYMVPEEDCQEELITIDNTQSTWIQNYQGVKSIDTLLTEIIANHTVLTIYTEPDEFGINSYDALVIGYCNFNDDIILSIVNCGDAMKFDEIKYSQIDFLSLSDLIKHGCSINYNSQFEE